MTVIIELNEPIDLYYINIIFSTKCKSIQIFLKFIFVWWFHFRKSWCILMDDVTFILSTVPLFLVMFSTCNCSQAGKDKFHYLPKSPKFLCSITSFLALNIKKTKSSPSNGAQNVGSVIGVSQVSWMYC